MPGRLTPPMPDRLSPQWAISALTSVPVAWPGGRMHHQAGRLVDDDDVVVLVDDVERDALALGLGRLRRRHLDRDDLAGVDAIAGIADRAGADRDRAVQDQRLEPRARQFGAGGEHAVEPFAGLFAGDVDGFLVGCGIVVSWTPMSNPELDDDKPLAPEQQKIVAKVRWLMLISGFATVLGIAVVIGVIGYRVFRTEGSVAPAEVTALLPKGAKVVATAVADDRIVVTIEVGGTSRCAPSISRRCARPGGCALPPSREAAMALALTAGSGLFQKPCRQLPSSSGPGRRPLTAKTGVRVPRERQRQILRPKPGRWACTGTHVNRSFF